ncbi:uncharacterized protein LOC107471259 [Arachis duranensis]|uniref:Uncharacterized protein LOC107471259 n=1 Tax=Arachis duranensis TaxID=130453 RepID=A0A9C6WMS1_ARADU|nr:uncharacterized protein LOC107471259 [Arachis duranensis]
MILVQRSINTGLIFAYFPPPPATTAVTVAIADSCLHHPTPWTSFPSDPPLIHIAVINCSSQIYIAKVFQPPLRLLSQHRISAAYTAAILACRCTRSSLPFDVALLVPLLAPVLSLQHILFPISRPFKDNFATLKETEFAVNTLQRAELQNILSNNGIGIGNSVRFIDFCLHAINYPFHSNAMWYENETSNYMINGFNSANFIGSIIKWKELNQTYDMAEKCLTTNYFAYPLLCFSSLS